MIARFVDTLTPRQLRYITVGCYAALCLMLAVSVGFDVAAEYRKDATSITTSALR